jgi:D-glycero-D-manno-heptose 1,7-bisphosphate phosphatase
VSGRPAVFLDRDGVLIEDVGLLVRENDLRVLEDSARTLNALHAAGYALVIVTNQTVVSRGLATEQEVDKLNTRMLEKLRDAGAPPVDAIYICPHHPNATLDRYRVDCDCRKPRPGLLLRASRELGLDLAASTMVGDRLSDVTAGMLAGCRTVLVRSGAHAEPPIESPLELDRPLEPDFVCDDLTQAAAWILAGP